MAYKNKEAKKEYDKRYKMANSEKINSDSKIYYAKNKEQIDQRHKEYHRENSGKIKNSTLLRRYGISLEQYNNMLLTQNGVCAICKKPETHKHKSGVVSSLSVDHNHTTGEVRGLLCHKCNNAIGYLQDSIDIAKALVNYLEKDMD